LTDQNFTFHFWHLQKDAISFQLNLGPAQHHRGLRSAQFNLFFSTDFPQITPKDEAETSQFSPKDRFCQGDKKADHKNS